MKDVQRWEREFHNLLLASYSGVLDKINSGSKLKDIEPELLEAIKQQKIGFTKDA